MPPALDLTSCTFGRWTVVGFSHTNERGARYWLCRCICGFEKPVLGSVLARGDSQGCQACKGASLATHGQSGTRLHTLWIQMRNRCSNPDNESYRHYGAKGITVAPEWEDFACFARDVGQPPSTSHTLERLNPFAGYVRNNICWAPSTAQAANRTNTHRPAGERAELMAAAIASPAAPTPHSYRERMLSLSGYTTGYST
jgi:hypothetical protein